jgi:hypothetical protein
MTDAQASIAAVGVDHQSPAVASLKYGWTFCRRCHELKPLEQMRADLRFKTGRRPL